MVFIDRRDGHCFDTPSPPTPDSVPVPGRGALFRRRRGEFWAAAHAFLPDSALWLAQGWERVRFRAARPPAGSQSGARSGLRFAFAPPTERERRGRDHLWVVLLDETGCEAPAERPGAQGLFRLDALAAGLPPAAVASTLLTSRIIRSGLPLESSLWVLKGPPVAPSDAKLLRRLEPVLALAERLSEDLRAAVAAGAHRAAARRTGGPAPSRDRSRTRPRSRR